MKGAGQRTALDTVTVELANCLTACQLSDALKEALEKRTYSGLLLAISTGALIELQRGNVARSLEYYTAIAKQPLVANSVWYADIAGKEIAAAANQLPVDVRASARQNGEKADLWETGQRLADSLFV